MALEKTPTVSIICTVYNKEKWLRKAIESFLSQEDVEIEIILIDDASTDHSKEIIQEFARSYPKKIVPLYNEKNLGITKTWIKACLAAKGSYIARCDGDDYWITKDKLVKQLKLLQENPDSKWCGTDIDFVDINGVTTEKNVFTQQVISLSDSYEKLIATRGFTAPSTWLVERDVMLRVNEMLQEDEDTADDTFNLQLDLFHQTQFSFLAEATVAYRVNQGSDSRPQSAEALHNRFDKLLATQLSYLNKYPKTDYKKILQILLERHNAFEKELSQLSMIHSRVNAQKVKIYYALNHQAFSEETFFSFQLHYHDSLSFTVPTETTAIRIDLSELPSFYQKVALVAEGVNTEVLPSFSNGILVGNYVLFLKEDPQLIYDISKIPETSFTLSYQMFNVDNILADDYIAKILAKDLKTLTDKVKELSIYQIDYQRVEQERQHLKKELEDMVVRYHSVVHSRRWTIPSKIIDFFRKGKN